MDLAALDAALELGIPCGGYCPKGRRSEAGRIPDKYPVTELATPTYPAQTKKNVEETDGTLVYRGPVERGDG